ncbi:BadF/BadG/BcrA/BcrD ATPase family protein [Pseudophaeobacter sp. EL27]|uniref:BadF/BadG/BcrA/BcrD ATPase family protein n=1 Tax=Pseudophaeobacter sp. EL27 TaxID=2107580 RepID=UPI000EFD9216|nr:BadF/BadG/BcrA/BcrD ATPase family protein [Pseudophaeobacter sp. EL27]
MTQRPPSALLAIDGGGTRCRIALERAGEILVVESGPANASSDFDETLVQIRLGLEQLSHKANLPLAQLTEVPAFVGLAGVVSSDIAQRLAQHLPLTRTHIEDDRPAALRGALGNAEGAISHCGTGSFLASQIKGERRIIGGWGQHLGDQASAQWLGRLALARTLNVIDGLEPASPLSATLLSRFSNSAQIVAFAAQASPMEFGALARDVTRHASAGDALAMDLMRQGAHYISEILPRIGWTPGQALCLTGGLAPEYRAYLPCQMQDDLQPPQGDPLSGALALARDFATKAQTIAQTEAPPPIRTDQ